MIQAIVFYLFATIVVASGVMVIAARNPVHSVLWLILAFFNAAGLFLILGAEFLAMILVIVYVGAVAVLFLFVVMMLDIDFRQMQDSVSRYRSIGVLLGLILAVELVLVGGAWAFGDLSAGARMAPVNATPGLTNTQSLGTILYTDYVFIFQAAGMILLTAMIGAIVLTLRSRPGVRRQDISRQNARTPATSISVERPTVGVGVDTSAGVKPAAERLLK